MRRLRLSAGGGSLGPEAVTGVAHAVPVPVQAKPGAGSCIITC